MRIMKKLIILFLVLTGLVITSQVNAQPKRVIPVDEQGNIIGTSGVATTGGGGALTGVSTYSNVSGNFEVEAIDYTNTIWIMNAPFTVGAENLAAGSGKVWDTSTGEITDLDMTKIGAISGDTVTLPNQTNFTPDDSVFLFLIAPTKGFDIGQNASRSTLLNPDYAHYTDIDHIVNFTNLDTDSVYAVFTMESYQYINLHINVSGGVTVRVYVTNNSAAADDNHLSDWLNYGTEILGAGSITDTEVFEPYGPFQPLKVMINVETSDATNAADVWLRRWY